MTGIFLAFYYVPDAAGNPAAAYLSVRDVIDNQVYLAWLVSMLRLGLGAVILVASLMCFLGTSWDIHWHTLIGRDRILIPPHEIMLGGVALSGIAATADIVLETIWADCAQHVLHHFEQARPRDDRPRRAIELGRAWARGEELAEFAALLPSGVARHASLALAGSPSGVRKSIGKVRTEAPGFLFFDSGSTQRGSNPRSFTRT